MCAKRTRNGAHPPPTSNDVAVAAVVTAAAAADDVGPLLPPSHLSALCCFYTNLVAWFCMSDGSSERLSRRFVLENY